MGMVALQQRIASTFFVVLGNYGDVTRHAKEQGIARQLVYHRAKQVIRCLEEPWREELARLRRRSRELEDDLARLQKLLDRAVVLDPDKQADFAIVGQAAGVSLPQCDTLLKFLVPDPLPVSTLGRRTKAAGEKAGALLEVLDEVSRERVKQVAADEIYVKDPVLMTVEPESMCWTGGRRSAAVSGEAWADEFRQLPNLEQVTRDGGTGLAKGVGLVNAERRAADRPAVVDQGDHFHAWRDGGIALARAQRRVAKALTEAEAAQEKLDDCKRRGQDARGAGKSAGAAWRRAEQAMDTWQQYERIWQQVKAALQLVTPQGECNTREKATAALAELLPQWPDGDFAKVKRALRKPEMFAYLDDVQEKLAKVPYDQADARGIKERVAAYLAMTLPAKHPEGAVGKPLAEQAGAEANPGPLPAAQAIKEAVGNYLAAQPAKPCPASAEKMTVVCQDASNPTAAQVKDAAVQLECLRRRPELSKGSSVQAAAMRGVMMACTLILAKGGVAAQQVAEAVRGIMRGAQRASSLVECINSALRMQQARHRKMSQGLLDLKRLYWNCHTFRTGRRRHTSPYERLGVPWPEGVPWWEVLKWSPEQLRAKLSTAQMGK